MLSKCWLKIYIEKQHLEQCLFATLNMCAFSSDSWTKTLWWVCSVSHYHNLTTAKCGQQCLDMPLTTLLTSCDVSNGSAVAILFILFKTWSYLPRKKKNGRNMRRRWKTTPASRSRCSREARTLRSRAGTLLQRIPHQITARGRDLGINLWVIIWCF